MLNQEYDQSLNSLVNFNIAFCQLYCVELQQQKLYKGLLELQREINTTHNITTKRFVPQEELTEFFTSVLRLAAFHNYKIINYLNILANKLMPEVRELLNMHLRLYHLKTDNGYIPNSDFDLNSEIFTIIHHLSKTSQLKIINLQKSITEVYLCQANHLLQQHGFNSEYKELLQDCTTLAQGLINNVAQNRYHDTFKKFFTAKLQESCLQIINYHTTAATHWHSLHTTGSLNAHGFINDKKPAYKPDLAPSLLKANLPQYSKQELILTMTKFNNPSKENWLSLLDLEQFQQLASAYDISTNLENHRIISLNVLSEYGHPLLQITPIYANNLLMHLEVRIITQNITCSEDFETAKKLLAIIARCYQHPGYQEIVIDTLELPNIKDLVEKLLAFGTATILFSERTSAIVAKNLQKHSQLCNIHINPSLSNVYTQTQNILDLGLIPSLTAGNIIDLRSITLSQNLVINVIDYHTILNQLKFCCANGIACQLSHECLETFKNSSSEDCVVKIFAITSNDLIHKIQLVLDLGLIPLLEISHDNLACIANMQEHLFYLSANNEKMLYTQLKECSKQGIWTNFKDENIGHKLSKYLNKNHENHPFLLNFNHAKIAIRAAEYISKFGLRFHFTLDSWLKVIKYSEQKDLTLALEFKNPSFDDFKRLIENGFVLHLDEADKQYLINDINKIGQEDEHSLAIIFNKYPTNSAKNIFYKTQYIEEINKNTNYPICYFNDKISEQNNLLELATYINTTLAQELLAVTADQDLYKLISQYLQENATDINPLKKLADIKHIWQQAGKEEQMSNLIAKFERMLFGLYHNLSKEDNAVVDKHFARQNKYVNLAINFTKIENNELTIRAQKVSQITQNTKATLKNDNLNKHEINLLNSQEQKIISNANPLDLEDIEYLSSQAIIQRIILVNQRFTNNPHYLTAQLLAELKSLAIKLSKFGSNL